jgi:hypothetical protein
MTQTIILTIIVCITVITVFAICVFAPSKDKQSQRLEDIRKLIDVFESEHIAFDHKEGEYKINASSAQIRTLLKQITRIS